MHPSPGSKFNFKHPVWNSFALRYGPAVMFVGAAFFLSLMLQPYLSEAYLILFLIAVMASGWFGLTGPALFAVSVSIIAVDYYFIAPFRVFVMDTSELPLFLSFFACALVGSWLSATRRQADDKRMAHFDELFEQAPEAIMLLDLEGRVLRINPEFTRMFGYSLAELAGKDGMSLIVPQDLRGQAQISEARRREGETVSLETQRLRKDGSMIYVSELGVPITFAGKKISYYIIFRDITERRKASEALERFQAEVAHLSRVTTMGELVASISHEVNQPIGAVVTNGNAALRFLDRQPPDLHEVRGALEAMVRDANRASSVVGRIRSLLANTAPQMGQVNLNEVIQSVIPLIDSEVRRNQVILHTNLQDHLPPVRGDRVQLQQVLLNLMMNSIDAMSAQAARRTLEIASSCDVKNLLVRVQDSGPGIAPESMDAIFDAFYTTKPDGIGMGLSISRSIVESHGGKLWATTATPAGAVLQFTLPIAESNS